MAKKVILAGGNGFLGQALGRRLRERGHEVVVLTRSHPRRRGDGLREVQWDGRTAGPWAAELEGAEAVVNLAGRTINCVHHAENRRAILQTRLDAVAALGAAAAAGAHPPAAWVQASAVGYYGTRDERRCDESAAAGNDALAQVCRQWEEAFQAACPANVRPVVLRIGVVLGRKAGAFPRLARAVRLFAGGPAGDGRQGFSWIHLTDLEDIFLRAIRDEAMRGAYNACAPGPVGNAEFMRTLRQVLHRPWCPPAPEWFLRPVLRFIVGTEPDLVLRGQFVVPARLLAEGYRFKYGQLPYALADLVDRR
jgi:hypothetical protein